MTKTLRHRGDIGNDVTRVTEGNPMTFLAQAIGVVVIALVVIIGTATIIDHLSNTPKN